MVASQEAGGAGLRYGVASMWSPLRRVLVGDGGPTCLTQPLLRAG